MQENGRVKGAEAPANAPSCQRRVDHAQDPGNAMGRKAVSEGWLCRDMRAFDAFVGHIKTNWDWAKPLLVKWQDGRLKSHGQISLVHVWFRVLADHVNKHQPGHDFTEQDLKTEMKRLYGIRLEKPSPVTMEKTVYLKSLGDYTKGELHDFMSKVDRYAVCIGCLLPVHGEYEDLAKRQVQ